MSLIIIGFFKNAAQDEVQQQKHATFYIISIEVVPPSSGHTVTNTTVRHVWKDELLFECEQHKHHMILRLLFLFPPLHGQSNSVQ